MSDILGNGWRLGIHEFNPSSEIFSCNGKVISGEALNRALKYSAQRKNITVDQSRVEEIRLRILEIVATATNLEIETATKTLDIAFKS